MRWDRAFSVKEVEEEPSPHAVSSRKATLVIEYLLQASDVAHTMQHWNVFRKRNELFFIESVKAHRAGRAINDPVEVWYKEELDFFDHYVIPLANKLRESGVYGTSSDEYLTYALKNRQEWERCRQEVVSEMAVNLNSQPF